MSSAPERGMPHRQRRHHHHHHYDKHQRQQHFHYNQDHRGNQLLFDQPDQDIIKNCGPFKKEENEKNRPKVNPIFLWAAQREQRIIEVRCEDYDKRNRIKLTKTAQGWRSIPRTALTTYPIIRAATCETERQVTLSTTIKNQGKENNSSESLVRQDIVNEFDKMRINDASQLCTTDHNHNKKIRDNYKRKQYIDILECKGRVNLGAQKPSRESIVISNWKMRKIRSITKSKRRKKISMDEKTSTKNRANFLDKMQIKRESKKEINNIEKGIKTDKDKLTEDKHSKKYTGDNKKIGNLSDDLKKNVIKNIQRDQHFQPRVVLEQLHLSQIPSRIHRRLLREKRLKNSIEKYESNNKTSDDKIIGDNVKISNGNEIKLVKEDNIMNKEDLQKILNMLGSNHFLKNEKRTESNIKSNINNEDDDTINFLPIKCAKHEYSLKSVETRNNLQHCIASTTLDKTIEKLEKSINFQKKNRHLSNISLIPARSSNKRKIADCQTLQNASKSSKMLKNSRNTASMSISSLINNRARDYSNVYSNSIPTVIRNVLPSSKIPCSQSKIFEEIVKSLPQVSIVTSLQNRLKTESPIIKYRVESPESTVNFADSKQSLFERDPYKQDKHQDSDSQNIVDSSSQMNLKNHKNVCDVADEIHSVHFTKKRHQMAISEEVLINSEVEAKSPNVYRRKEVGNCDSKIMEEFYLQLSPQSNGTLSTTSLKKSSSAYFKRLLTSPPCSVSSSEDAKNDLTLKGVLFSPGNSNSKNEDVKERKPELNILCDSELNVSKNYSEQRFLEEYSNDIINQRFHKRFQQSVKYSETVDHERSASSSNVHSPFIADYISSKLPLTAEWTVNNNEYFANSCYSNKRDNINLSNAHKAYSQVSSTVCLDPASQLRELMETSRQLIPDPLLVPKDYLPLLAGSPLTEIPKLLAARPELRLPEALSRPDLLRDPNLLVISLAHLQFVLDSEEELVTQTDNINELIISQTKEDEVTEQAHDGQTSQQLLKKPRLSCKPIRKLMPIPMDLSNNYKCISQPPLLTVRNGLLKQESEVTSTANSPDDLQLWHPLFGR